ncbi:MAG: polysaccharide deacetylase family protein [Minisyncoccia bacterium]
MTLTHKGHGSWAVFIIAAFLFAGSAQSAYAQNLIQNPGLETAGVGGVPANWIKTFWGTPTPTFTYPATGHAGNGATVAFSAASNGDARWQPDAVAVEAGATYTYSAWYKSSVASEVNIEYTNASNAVSYGWVADVPSSANVWKQVTGTFTVPSGITKASVFQIISAAGNLSVDDVSLTKNGTTPPPTTPTVTLSASPANINQGQSSTLTWSSTNTTGCTASNGWSGAKAVSGNESVAPTATTTYALICTGAGGEVSKQVVIGVKASSTPPAPQTPTLTFTASPTSINAGQSSTLSWSATNVTSCTASNGWTGTKALSGTQSVSPSATTTYTLACTGSNGNITKNVAVNIIPVAPTQPGQFAQGMVSITFDDSWLTQYTNALPILQTAGLKGTFYLTTEPIQQAWDGFMTPNQAKDIANKGHEIAGHTVSHADLATLTQAKINAEIKNSKTYLQTLTGQTVVSLAYPYGSFNNTVKTLTKNAGYTTGRGVDFETRNIATTDKYALKSQCIETGDSIASIKAQIDAAKTNKQWYVLCVHEVKNGGDQYSTTPARLQEIVNYIKSTGIKVVTVKEGRALMSN